MSLNIVDLYNKDYISKMGTEYICTGYMFDVVQRYLVLIWLVLLVVIPVMKAPSQKKIIIFHQVNKPLIILREAKPAEWAKDRINLWHGMKIR